MEIDKNSIAENGVDNNEVSLLGLLTVFARHKIIVIATPLVFGVTALAVSFLIKPTFISTAVIMPPQQQSSGVSAMLGQLGGLAGVAGLSPLKNPNDLYIGMLKSRTVADNLINDYQLKERYELKTMDSTRKALERLSNVVDSKTGLLSISVEDRDPEFAAKLANAYVKELVTLNQKMAIGEASQRRLFYEKQLKSAKDELADAEVAMRKMQESTGMVQLDGQVKGIIANVAQLQATIATKEVQLASIRSYASVNNPEVIRIQNEIQGLNTQMSKLTKGKPSEELDLMVATGKIPAVGVEYVRSVREVKFHEAVFEILAKQYEVAKIDEAKDSSVIQQLDIAIPAELKAKPLRGAIVLLSTLAGGMLGLFLALMRDAYLRSRQSVSGARRWQALGRAWKNTESI